MHRWFSSLKSKCHAHPPKEIYLAANIFQDARIRKWRIQLEVSPGWVRTNDTKCATHELNVFLFHQPHLLSFSCSIYHSTQACLNLSASVTSFPCPKHTRGSMIISGVSTRYGTLTPTFWNVFWKQREAPAIWTHFAFLANVWCPSKVFFRTFSALFG